MNRVPEPPIVAHARPQARRWVRLNPVANTHETNSRRFILEVAQQAEPGQALVLGAGRCDEVPLAELVERFEHVTLNDMDQEALDQAYAKSIPQAFQSKVTLQVADLTGVTERFLKSVSEKLQAAESVSDAIEQMAGVADRLHPLPLISRDTYDLIVASCVLSQLHVVAVQKAIELFAKRFAGDQQPQAIEELRQSHRWSNALLKMNARMEEELVNGIHRLLAPGGRAYFSDTVQFCFIHGADKGQWASDGTYRMTRTIQLSDYLDDRFQFDYLGGWAWVVDPPKAQGQVGRLYNVQALMVAPAT